MPLMSRRRSQLALLTDDVVRGLLEGRTTWRTIRELGVDDYGLVSARMSELIAERRRRNALH